MAQLKLNHLHSKKQKISLRTIILAFIYGHICVGSCGIL